MMPGAYALRHSSAAGGRRNMRIWRWRSEDLNRRSTAMTSFELQRVWLRQSQPLTRPENNRSAWGGGKPGERGGNLARVGIDLDSADLVGMNDPIQRGLPRCGRC